MKFFRSKKYRTLSELVLGCQRLEASAQTEFYKRYKAKLIGVCIRYARTRSEGEDIFQEAFIKVFRNITEIREVESVDSWVKSVVIRTAINYYNRTTRQQLLHEDLTHSDIILQSEDYESIIDRMETELVIDIISQLPDGYRMIVNLYLIDGYTHAEIAALLSITDGTVRSQYHRARNVLMKKLQKIGIDRYELPG
ncbi:RNA polymerase sigma-70 factor, ECF subfamily [Dyadobacter koreensis]|uniref:RNA polymerase sigma-70 factor, ECF subfamily n=1 Tax=Dyadobacter koreensis TaxID=408657 RepID=A0A1H6XP47_9BACT|nr:RNA polymerase sigma factor [Dyadobacter koreensis]SEJ26620.1 RNA polymerase sigma-70 factor, ECF subfamily [Dyadobacter koreensis]